MPVAKGETRAYEYSVAEIEEICQQIADASVDSKALLDEINGAAAVKRDKWTIPLRADGKTRLKESLATIQKWISEIDRDLNRKRLATLAANGSERQSANRSANPRKNASKRASLQR